VITGSTDKTLYDQQWLSRDGGQMGTYTPGHKPWGRGNTRLFCQKDRRIEM